MDLLKGCELASMVLERINTWFLSSAIYARVTGGPSILAYCSRSKLMFPSEGKFARASNFSSVRAYGNS